MQFEQRNIQINGKRTTIRLEDSAWAAVDLLAERDCITWETWCQRAIQAGDGDNNSTRAIRTHIIERLLTDAAIAERAEAGEAPEATGFLLSGVWCRPNEFSEAVQGAQEIQARVDLGTVEVLAGIDEFGRVAFYVKNRLEGCPSLTIATPFSESEWRDKLGDG